MGLNLDNLKPSAAIKPVADVATNFADNCRQVKISNNEREIQFDNNRLAAHQTTSNNNLAAFLGALNTGASIINGLFSVVNTAIQAYAQIQESHEQTRRVEIQADAYIAGKQEETRQVQIQAENETTRYLANLKADLEAKRLELDKFKLELAEQRAAREFSQEKWRQKVRAFENVLNPVLKYAADLRNRCMNSNFVDEKSWAELKRIDENIQAYVMQMNEIYK